MLRLFLVLVLTSGAHLAAAQSQFGRGDQLQAEQDAETLRPEDALLTAARQLVTPASEVANVDAVVREMCRKTVALIGESPVHGFGKTLEFKVELVRRLIDDCHYNALFFESGIYDFLNLQEQVKSG